MDLTDAELVAEVRAGSREAAATLAERYLRAARAFALAIVQDVAAADDVCQDAFVYAIEKIDDCRNPDRFAGWLMSGVRSRAHNHLRDSRVARYAPIDADSLPSGEPSPDRKAERSELRRRLLAAIGELSEERGSILLLHDLEGWTHREIAERLDMPPGTVRSHLHFARKKLRTLMHEFRDNAHG